MQLCLRPLCFVPSLFSRKDRFLHDFLRVLFALLVDLGIQVGDQRFARTTNCTMGVAVLCNVSIV